MGMVATPHTSAAPHPPARAQLALFPHPTAARPPPPPPRLADVRRQYNTLRLHAGIGYVTPADEHDGHGPASAPPANADSDTPAGTASSTIAYRKPKPIAGAPPMWTDSLPDLWL